MSLDINNTTPYELIGAPFSIYLAAVGTAFPAIDVAPGAGWSLLGSSGNLNLGDEGVTIKHQQAVNYFRAFGDSGSRKVFRSSEDLIIAAMLADCTLEQYANALNGNSVTTAAASYAAAAYKKVGLSRGLIVDTRALLVRGPSPYMADGYLQYEVPIVAQSGSPEIVFVRDNVAKLALEWTALVDVSAATADERFGRLKAMTAERTT